MNSNARYFSILLTCLFLILFVLLFQNVAATDNPPPFGDIQRVDTSLAVGVENGRIQQAPPTYEQTPATAQRSLNMPQIAPLGVYQHAFLTTPNNTINGNEVVCQELLLNREMNVVTFPDNTGNADPWSEVVEEIYFAGGSPTSPDFSLVLIDADMANGEVNDDALTPTQDSFGQGVRMPDNLQQIQIRYSYGTINTNATDDSFGEMWFLGPDGTLDTRHGSWPIEESDGVWATEGGVNINIANGVQDLQNRDIGLIFTTQTDGNVPGELVYLDDISLVACYIPTGSTNFLPTIIGTTNSPTPPQPICVLPGQSDTATERTGRIETGASCQDSLTPTDQRDNYIFTPNVNGNHVMRLQGVPNASATAFKINGSGSNVTYDTVNAAGGGDCRFTTAGNDRSKTCVFNANDSYLILIDRGQPQNSGDYTLSISR